MFELIISDFLSQDDFSIDNLLVSVAPPKADTSITLLEWKEWIEDYEIEKKRRKILSHKDIIEVNAEEYKSCEFRMMVPPKSDDDKESGEKELSQKCQFLKGKKALSIHLPETDENKKRKWNVKARLLTNAGYIDYIFKIEKKRKPKNY